MLDGVRITFSGTDQNAVQVVPQCFELHAPPDCHLRATQHSVLYRIRTALRDQPFNYSACIGFEVACAT